MNHSLLWSNESNLKHIIIKWLLLIPHFSLYREEEKFVLLANELPATLPKTEQADTKSAIELLKHLTAVNVTKTMLYKNISCVLNIYNLSKYNTNSGVSADLSKASQVNNSFKSTILD